MEIEVNDNVFNEVYIPYLFSYDERNYRYLVLLGGAGSGKSVFITQRTILRILREKNHRILVVRKVASTLRHSVYKLFKSIIYEWGLEKLFTFSDSYLTIKCNVSNSELVFLGIDNAEKLKSIAGITSIWIEEATELTETDFNQVNLRLRGKEKAHKEVILTFNPISETHWIKKRFYDTYNEDVIRLKTTYLDNKFLDKGYTDVLTGLKDVDPVYYNIYCLGEWGNTGSLVWSNYKIEKLAREDKFYDHIYVGLDFGYTDPSAMVKIGVKDSELYILREFYQTKLTNTQLIEKLQEFKSYRIIADCAEPDRIKEFYQNGFNITACKKGAQSVRYGIDFVRGRKIHIDPSCKNFIAEIQNYVYEKDNQGNITENPIGYNDHLMAALRYGTEPLRKQDSIQFLK